MIPHESDMLRSDQAAAVLKLSPGTLAKMRVRGDGPAYTKAGPRIVLYSADDLRKWLESRRRTSTSEPQAA